MTEKEWQEATIGQVVQFTENHKWCGSLGFIEEVKKCGDDHKFMICCTSPDNQSSCSSIYIYSMLSDNEFEPLLDGRVVLKPKWHKEESEK